MAEALSAPAAVGSTRERSTDLDTEAQGGRRPTELLSVRIFLILFAGLLVGYMFMGRGFAHVGIPPLYVGEVVLFVGLIATAIAFIRLKLRVHLSPIVWLLLAFMVWGLARTVPYLGVYGTDALRDAVLWGYATFAVILYVLVDRRLVLRAMRAYGGVVPIFAVWLPISFNLFLLLGASIDPNELGSNIPLIFFKSGDMSVHVVGSIAFLILGLGIAKSARSLLWRSAIVVPLLWTAFIAGATNRGGLVSVFIGLTVVAVLAYLLYRSRNWFPVLIAIAVLGVILAAPALAQGVFTTDPTSSTSSAPSVRASTTATPRPTADASVGASTSTASAGASEGSGEPASQPSAGPNSPSAPGFSAESLAPNSGFEVGIPGGGQIDGWAGAEGVYNIVAGDAYRGEKFASVEATGEPRSAMLSSAIFPFRAGDDISVSVRVKALRGSPSLEIYVHWYDRSGDHIRSSVAGTLAPGDTLWQEVTGILAAPPDATQAQILIWEVTGDGAAVGIDEVVVRSGDFVVPSPPAGLPTEGRPATIDQILENIVSVFSPSTDEGLEGTRRFRLRWWGAIVNYTIFGDYFWTGKGFGVNLADDDGFQANIDGSLRAPHNSHITALARMGVPGFVLWTILQATFGIGLLRSILRHRRAGDLHIAAVGGWLLAYWTAMMVNTSFDPYIEGPQGGIWFWAVFGLGMVVMRLTPRPPEA